MTLPRPAAGPTPLPSVSAAYAAYDVALSDYQTAATAFGADSAAHASAYNAVALTIAGLPCTSAAECVTGSAAFPGACSTPYYGHGQCHAVDATPLGVGPQPPARPHFTCADFTCAALPTYSCAQEVNTASIACVLSRCGGGGGGGGGGHH